MNQDIWIEVLSYLPLKDKVNSALVCKEWYHTNKYIYRNQIVKVSINILNSKTFQKWFEKHLCFIEITEPIIIEYVPKYIYNYIAHIRVKGLNCSSSSINELKQLQFLAAVFNRLTQLSSNIGELDKLQYLYLGHNQLTQLPETIGDLKNLHILCLNNNRLTSLPSSIGELKQLQSLNLFNNRLTSLPSSIGDLKQLEILELGNNRLTSLPSSISDLKQLQFLNLTGNLELPQIYLSSLEKSNTCNCLIFFQQ